MNVQAVLAQKGTQVHRVGPETAVLTAAHDLKRLGIGALVVCGDSGQVHGILTEKDVVHAVATHAGDLRGVRVADVMTRRVVKCAPTDDVTDVMARMTHHRTRHVPVIDHGDLVGIISIGDVVKSRLESMEIHTNILREAYIASH